VQYVLSCLLHLKGLYGSRKESSGSASPAGNTASPAGKAGYAGGGVILVGHSMGGLVARAAAAAAAARVDLGKMKYHKGTNLEGGQSCLQCFHVQCKLQPQNDVGSRF
jgi:hypothetical protein